jgi:hypothetical protein
MAIYKIESIPGKGQGLVALTDTARGTRILVENPLFRVLAPIHTFDSTVRARVEELSEDRLHQFLSLHNAHPSMRLSTGIFKTNALPCGSDTNVTAVYPTICLINHTCIPNAHNNWNGDLRHETIHAICDIKAGEEITISYAEGQTSTKRATRLKNAFGFDCTCALCSFPGVGIPESDARRISIERLNEAIGDPERMMSAPDRMIADCQKMLKLLHQEYAIDASTPFEAPLYYDAFQISIAHADQARASVFAERAYQARLICEGEDSPGTARMKVFMQDPEQHPSFGESERWRTAKSAVPHGIHEVLFEKWLWRRGYP